LYPVEIWDGETYCEQTRNFEIPEIERGETTVKYFSNSTTHVTPVVGPGTFWLKLTVTQAVKLMKRAKLLQPKVDLTWSGDLSSGGISPYPGASASFDLNVTALHTAGTERTDLVDKNESLLFCGAGISRWATRPAVSLGIFSFGPPPTTTGTGTATMDIGTAGYAEASIGAQCIDNPETLQNPYTSYRFLAIAGEPYVYAAPGLIWTSAVAEAYVERIYDISSSVGLNASSSLIELSLAEREDVLDAWDSFNEEWIPSWAVNKRTNINPTITIKIFGTDLVDYTPQLLRVEDTFFIDGDPLTAPTISDRPELTGTLDIEGNKYWPYKDADGNPLYDEDTGDRI
jgi:hypothetical protein